MRWYAQQDSRGQLEIWRSGQQLPQFLLIALLECCRVPDLQDAHAEGVAKNLMGFMVVAISNGGGGHKQREGVLRLRVQKTPLHHLVNLSDPLLPVTAQRLQP